MFFSITTTTTKDDRFFNIHNIHNFLIHLDNGWKHSQYNDQYIFYKGYCDNQNINDIIPTVISDPIPKYTGNFCIIIVSKNDVIITHNNQRTFPIYSLSSNGLTNLPRLDPNLINEIITADHLVSLTHNDIKKLYIGYHTYTITEQTTVDYVATQIKNLLVEKVYNTDILADNIFAFISGGVDTWLVFALIKYTKIPYKLLFEEHFELTRFTQRNHDIRSNHPQLWGYKQMHHWRTPSVLGTGGNGDGMFMRGPTTIQMWCNWHNINLYDIIKNTDCYHQKYFLKDETATKFLDKWNHKKEIQDTVSSYSELCNKIIGFLTNDHQHWHLENTLTWTPLNDLRITELILSLPQEEILNQMLDATINKAVIKILAPELLQYIDDYKNYNKHNNTINFPEIGDIINGK